MSVTDKVVHVGSYSVSEETCMFADFHPGSYMEPEQRVVVSDSRSYAADITIKMQVAGKADSIGHVTAWWVPGTVRGYSHRMIQSDSMVNDQTKTLELKLPRPAFKYIGGDDQYGIIALRFRGIVPQANAKTMSISLSVRLIIDNVVGECSAPGMYDFPDRTYMVFESDRLTRAAPPPAKGLSQVEVKK